jgi:hypothetical protein
MKLNREQMMEVRSSANQRLADHALLGYWLYLVTGITVMKTAITRSR